MTKKIEAYKVVDAIGLNQASQEHTNKLIRQGKLDRSMVNRQPFKVGDVTSFNPDGVGDVFDVRPYCVRIPEYDPKF